MNRLLPFVASACLAQVLQGVEQPSQWSPKLEAPIVGKTDTEPFPLTQVRLLDGPFKQAMESDQRYILSLNPDRLLHTFRLTAGLPSSAMSLGGWEDPKGGLRGHFLGHYLTACTEMYQSTGNPVFKDRAEKVIKGLAECQKAIGSGYVSAFPATVFDTLETKCGGVWAPYYTMHKILAGLLDCYQAFGDKQALQVAERMADYFSGRMNKLTPEQIDKVLKTTSHAPQNEFGGMSDVLHRLYLDTGRASDLNLAEFFDRDWIVDPMAKGEDTLPKLHANTHIAQSIGWWTHYLVTGERKYLVASKNFWELVTRNHSYAEGGNSNKEHFCTPGAEAGALSPETAETCNVYNMLKLTRDLFQTAPSVELGDYYEKALLNHILGSIDPEMGATIYFLNLQSGGFKVYSTPLDSFWCCNGTGIENHAKYGEGIYFHAERKLWVNLYIASELDWRELGVKVRQETAYPVEQGSTLRFKMTQPQEFEVILRIPSWATNGNSVTLNGRKLDLSPTGGTLLPVNRVWKDGDTLKLDLPMSLRAYQLPDDPKSSAFFVGPVLLAGELGHENYPASDHAKGQLDLAKLPTPLAPLLLDADSDHPSLWLKPLPGKPLTFTSGSSTRPANIVFSPLYAIHHQRYAVYWKSERAGSP
jgi:hypothetical protein